MIKIRNKDVGVYIRNEYKEILKLIEVQVKNIRKYNRKNLSRVLKDEVSILILEDKNELLKFIKMKKITYICKLVKFNDVEVLCYSFIIKNHIYTTYMKIQNSDLLTLGLQPECINYNKDFSFSRLIIF